MLNIVYYLSARLTALPALIAVLAPIPFSCVIVATFFATSGAIINTANGAARIIYAQNVTGNFTVTNVSGAPGQPIPLNIDIADVDEKNAGQLFIFTGIPKGIQLSKGGFFNDFWAVTARDVAGLTLMAPAAFSGSFQVKITRARNQDTSSRSTIITVSIGEAQAQDPPPPAANAQNPNNDMLMARAKKLFEGGDVSGARIIFEYLAANGSAAAAIAMGETYDPVALRKVFVKGLTPDPDKAQFWYERAEQLGSGEARSRLNELAAR